MLVRFFSFRFIFLRSHIVLCACADVRVCVHVFLFFCFLFWERDCSGALSPSEAETGVREL